MKSREASDVGPFCGVSWLTFRWQRCALSWLFRFREINQSGLHGLNDDCDPKNMPQIRSSDTLLSDAELLTSGVSCALGLIQQHNGLVGCKPIAANSTHEEDAHVDHVLQQWSSISRGHKEKNVLIVSNIQHALLSSATHAKKIKNGSFDPNKDLIHKNNDITNPCWHIDSFWNIREPCVIRTKILASLANVTHMMTSFCADWLQQCKHASWSAPSCRQHIQREPNASASPQNLSTKR